ncbi:MAG: InlB B-repeat-containing protein, partial [Treponema sp.]|nr:InlB B-repeat-containing protein [Treponema sp.]
TSISSITVSGNNSFTVVPNTGLAAGTYTATVTVSGGNGITASFNVSFTVNPTIQRTITWNLNGGSWVGSPPVTSIANGGTLSAPTNPTKTNANFVGWFTNAALTTPYTFGTAVNANLTLYAKWQQITPMFYWGNYIPSTRVMAGVGTGADSAFNLDDFIANIDNARKRHSLDWDWDAMEEAWGEDEDKWNEWIEIYDGANNIIINSDGSKGIFNGGTLLPETKYGQYTLVGAFLWEEFKSSEIAVKSNKNITWNNQMGYLYFISPREFGNITITQGGLSVMSTYTKHEIIIDGINYDLYVLVVQLNPFTATQIFAF